MFLIFEIFVKNVRTHDHTFLPGYFFPTKKERFNVETLKNVETSIAYRHTTNFCCTTRARYTMHFILPLLQSVDSIASNSFKPLIKYPNKY